MLANATAGTRRPHTRAAVFWLSRQKHHANADTNELVNCVPLICVSDVRTIGAVSILQPSDAVVVHTENLRASAQTRSSCEWVRLRDVAEAFLGRKWPEIAGATSQRRKRELQTTRCRTRSISGEVNRV